MPTFTICNIDDALWARLQLRAARNGVSMEAEARSILHTALATSVQCGSGASLYAAIRARVRIHARRAAVDVPRRGSAVLEYGPRLARFG